MKAQTPMKRLTGYASGVFAGLMALSIPATLSAQSGNNDLAANTNAPTALRTSYNATATNDDGKTYTVAPDPDEKKVPVGNAADAQDASMLPDARHVGVYLIIGENYPYSVEYMRDQMKKYFDAYNLPVQFYQKEKPEMENGCMAAIYVGGQSYKGDLPNGAVSPKEFFENHRKVFTELSYMYVRANPKIALALEKD